MKYLISLLLYFGLFNSDLFTDLNPKILKSLDKEIQKIWKNTAVTKVPLKISQDVADELGLDAGNNFVLTSGKDTLAYAFVRRTNGCVIGGCTNPNSPVVQTGILGERYEHFDYLLILNKDLSVRKVKILVYEGEYGYEVGSKLWLKQFIGYKGGRLEYGRDIQAISGATVSAQSITDDIQVMHQIAKKMRAKGII